MISDSIANASISMASSNPKDFAKKKKANRSAKLKQCKLDARREQWLSQGINSHHLSASLYRLVEKGFLLCICTALIFGFKMVICQSTDTVD